MEGGSRVRVQLDNKRGALELERRRPTASVTSVIGNVCGDRIRGGTAGEEKGSISGRLAAMLPIKSFSSSKTGRKVEINNRFIGAKQIYRKSTVQNDKSSHLKASNVSACMGVYNRHSRRIFTCAGQTMPTQVSSVCNGSKAVLFQSTPVRVMRGAKSVHDGFQVASVTSSRSRNKCNSLFRRLGSVGGVRGDDKKTCAYYGDVLKRSGVSTKLGEIEADTHAKVCLVRGAMGFGERSLGITPVCGSEIAREHKESLGVAEGFQKRLGKNNRLPGVCLSACSESETSIFPASKGTMVWKCSRSRYSPTNSRDFERGASAMARGRVSRERSTTSVGSSNGVLVDRCLSFRLGCSSFQQTDSARRVEHRGEDVAYKFARASGDQESFSNPAACQNADPDIHGQHSCIGCTEQEGFKESEAASSNLGSFRSGFRGGRSPERSENSKRIKCSSRWSLKESTPSDRVGIAAAGVQQTGTVEGPASGGSFCDPAKRKAKEVCLSIQTPRSSGGGCFSDRLEQMGTNLLVSSKKSADSGDGKIVDLSASRNDDCAMEADQAMVRNTQEAVQQVPTARGRSRTVGTGKIHSLRIRLLRKLDRIRFLKRVMGQKFGMKVAGMLSSAYRASTNKQAQSTWSSFQKWLPESTKLVTLRTVLNFLVYKFKREKVSARTILGCKNALALPMWYGFGVDVASKEFSLLSRAMFLHKPPRPRLFPSWSINKVLEFFSQAKFHLRWASIHDLLLKTLFLVALASGSRISELAALSRRGIVFQKGSVVLIVKEGFLLKNQTMTHCPSNLVIPALNPPHQLCPVLALKSYIERTCHLEHKDQVFLSPSSNVPLKAGRLAYWLCKGISLADPNVKVRAHDVRKQAFSLAWVRGVPLRSITERGFWLSPNTFIDKYLVPVTNYTANYVAGGSV